jgi:6-methylsalicylate decarboxylase
MIDLHAHFLTESAVEAARAAGHTTPDGMPAGPTWSVDAHLALMDAVGIERAIVSLSSPGVHFGDDAAARALARETNAFAAGLPDRFGHLAILPLPDVDGALAELPVAFDEGAAGVVLLSNAAGSTSGRPPSNRCSPSSTPAARWSCCTRPRRPTPPRRSAGPPR